MGLIQHNAIVMTTWREDVKEFVEKALSLGCSIIGPSDTQMNDYVTVCIVPDGSKEGWEDSDKGDERRAALHEWLQSTDLTWVEVSFGECGNSVVTGSAP